MVPEMPQFEGLLPPPLQPTRASKPSQAASAKRGFNACMKVPSSAASWLRFRDRRPSVEILIACKAGESCPAVGANSRKALVRKTGVNRITVAHHEILSATLRGRGALVLAAVTARRATRGI